MTNFDWLALPSDVAEYEMRLDLLIDRDVLQIVRLDPRDAVMGTMLYWHPEPIPMRAQINGVFELGVPLAQLIVTDLVAAGFMQWSATGNLEMTTEGLDFARARLTGPDINSIYRLREDPALYRPLSNSLSVALKHLILHDSAEAHFLIEDAHHPALGRVKFD